MKRLELSKEIKSYLYLVDYYGEGKDVLISTNPEDAATLEDEVIVISEGFYDLIYNHNLIPEVGDCVSHVEGDWVCVDVTWELRHGRLEVIRFKFKEKE